MEENYFSNNKMWFVCLFFWGGGGTKETKETMRKVFLYEASFFEKTELSLNQSHKLMTIELQCFFIVSFPPNHNFPVVLILLFSSAL